MWQSSKCTLVVFTLQVLLLGFGYGLSMSRRPNYYYDNHMGYSINESQVAAYNPESQLCCSGNVFTTSVNSYQKCCGSSEFDVTRQVCCGDKTYSLKIGYHCCGSEYFSVKEAKCCTSSVTGDQTLLAFPANVVKDAEAIQRMKCCGSKVIDSRTHICCSQMRRYHTYYQPRRLGRIYSHSRHRSRHYHRYLPMRRLQFTIYEKKFAQTGCCKGKIYNKKEKTCPSNIGHERNAYERRYRNHYARRTHSRRIHRHHYPMYGICNRKTYNVKTHVCCTLVQRNGTSPHAFTHVSKIVEATSPRTSCCGLEAYDWEKQICCDNKQIHPQNAEMTMECCGLTVYDTTTKRCCASSDVVEDVEKLPESADSCCGKFKLPFDSETQVCCGNKVFDIPKENSSSSTRSSRYYHSSPRFYCCWDEESNQEPSIYNPRSEICCGGVKHANSGHRSGCCGSETVDWHDEVCCNDKKVKRESRYDACCGNRTYNSRHELCCDYAQGFVLQRKSRGDSCCGNVTYDYREQLCCRGDYSLLGARSSGGETAVFFKPTHSMVCCNLTAMDSKTHECCEGKVIDKKKQLCCHHMDKEGMFDSVTLIDKSSNKSRCCGKEAYDPDTQQCCDNHVLESGDRSLSCCGSQLYDAAKQTCCDDSVFDQSQVKNGKCCGNKYFDSEKHICCSGVVKKIADPGSETQCCYSDDV